MQRIFNVDKWSELSEGRGLVLRGAPGRLLRLHVNAPSEARLFLTGDDGETRFLALVKGRDQVECYTPSGEVVLSADGGEVWIYTADGETEHHVEPAPEIFTKIVERRRRSPELDHIVAQMTANMNRRLEQQARELEQLFVNREKARSALGPAQGVPGGPGSVPGQADQPESSGASAAEAVGGRDG